MRFQDTEWDWQVVHQTLSLDALPSSLLTANWSQKKVSLATDVKRRPVWFYNKKNGKVKLNSFVSCFASFTTFLCLQKSELLARGRGISIPPVSLILFVVNFTNFHARTSCNFHWFSELNGKISRFIRINSVTWQLHHQYVLFQLLGNSTIRCSSLLKSHRTLT